MKKLTWFAIGVMLLTSVPMVSAESPITAQLGDEVRYQYTVRVDGKVIETTDEKIAEDANIYTNYEPSITIGSGEHIESKIEKQLIGIAVGGTKNFVVSPQDGYSTGMLEETDNLARLIQNSELTISSEEASPYSVQEYELSDFPNIIQKRIRVGANISSPYDASRRGTVKSMSGGIVEIQFPDTTHPFYNKKVKVGLVVRKDGVKFTVLRINPDQSVLLQIYNPDAPLDKNPTVGQIIDRQIITRVGTEDYSYIPEDNLIGKSLNYSVRLTRIDRTVQTDTVITDITSRMREEWDD